MKYYYTDGTNKFGPMSVEKLLISDINVNTLVWCDGMEEWVEAKEIPEIAEALKSVPPPIPKPEPEPTPQEEKVNTNTTPVPRMPKSWLVESILITIFCCLPFGIVGIINAWQVESRYNDADYAGATESSDEARRWCKYGLIIGLCLMIIPFILFLMMGVGIFSMAPRVMF